jgi:hypothetical protein
MNIFERISTLLFINFFSILRTKIRINKRHQVFRFGNGYFCKSLFDKFVNFQISYLKELYYYYIKYFILYHSKNFQSKGLEFQMKTYRFHRIHEKSCFLECLEIFQSLFIRENPIAF